VLNTHAQTTTWLLMSTLLLHKDLHVGTDGYHGKVLVQIANGSVQIANKSVQIANRSVQLAITTNIFRKNR
jgi:hypothetical protein